MVGHCVSEERSLKLLLFSLAEKVVEVLVIQTEEMTRQGVNMCVQPEIIEETVQRMKHIIKEKINQETKRIEVPSATGSS